MEPLDVQSAKEQLKGNNGKSGILSALHRLRNKDEWTCFRAEQALVDSTYAVFYAESAVIVFSTSESLDHVM